MTPRTPPKLATALLKHLGPRDDGLLGDVRETYIAGKSRAWYWGQVLAAVVLSRRHRLARNVEMAMEKMIVYVIGALALGSLTATLQGFGIGGSHWFAAAIGGPITGLLVGGAVRLFTPTNPLRWTFWMSVACW